MGKLRLSRDQFGSFLKQNPQFIREFERLFQEIDDAIDSLNLAPPATPSSGGSGGAPSGPAGGDLTGTYPNPSIAANAVDNTKLADMTGPTVKGRETGTGNPEDIAMDDLTTMLLVADPNTTMKVVGRDTVTGQMFPFDNLTHNSTTKTTTTATLVATIDVQTPNVAIDESALAPTAVADKAIIYVDASNNVLAMKESGTATRLDAIRVADSGALQGTRREINFTGAGVTVTDDAGNDRVNIDIPGGGGGGGTFGQATATFTGNQSAVTISVVDAGVSAGSNIVLSVDMGARFVDEFEMAPVLPVVGTITAGVGFTVLVACPGRDAVGDYLINYTRD